MRPKKRKGKEEGDTQRNMENNAIKQNINGAQYRKKGREGKDVVRRKRCHKRIKKAEEGNTHKGNTVEHNMIMENNHEA